MVASASGQLRAIAAALKEAGDRDNLNALRRGIRAEAAPLVSAVRQAAREDLPRRGGLNEYEANQRITTSVLTSARTTAVRIRGRATQATDTGTWRHPTFGRTGKGEWSDQSYPEGAGWWSRTMAEKSPEATALIVGELEKVASRIRAI